MQTHAMKLLMQSLCAEVYARGGTVFSTSKKVVGSNPVWSLSVWSVYVLPVSLWIIQLPPKTCTVSG